MIRAHNFDNKIGNKYGNLTVLSFNGTKITSKGKTKSLWLCECICGKNITVISGNLASGNTQNCGCKRDERLKFYVETKLKKPKGEAAFNAIYSKYEYGAKTRNLSFELDKNIFRILCLDICFYCKSDPSNLEAAVHKNGGFTYNGIDRVDNNLGYVLNNCVTCCKICNLMKRDLTQQQFLAHIEKIYKNSKLGEINEKK